MRYFEYVLGATGIALIGVLLARAIPDRPAPEPPRPAERPTPQFEVRLGPDLENLLTVAAAYQPNVPRIEGQVIAEDGTPIPGAPIEATGEHGRPVRGKTTATGSFAMTRPQLGTSATFRVDAPGLALIPVEPANGIVELNPKPEHTEGIQIILGKESTVSGVVVDESGAPRSDLRLMLHGTAEHFDEQPVRLDDQGTFSIRGLSAGRYHFHFDFRNSYSAKGDQEFELEQEENLTGLRVIVPRRLTERVVSGIVMDMDHKAVEGASVYATRTDSRDWTDEQGRFSIIVDEFPVEIRATRVEFTISETSTVDAATNDLRLVLRPPAYISGQVVYAETGVPVEAFRFPGRRRANDGSRFRRVPVSAHVSSIAVDVPRYPRTYATIDPPLKEGEHRELEFRVPAGRQFEGRVIDASGNPVTMARVAAEGAEGWGVMNSDITGEDGSFLLGPVVDGPAQIQVDPHQPNRPREQFTVTVSPAMPLAVLQLKRGYSLRVEVSGIDSLRAEVAGDARNRNLNLSVIVFAGDTAPPSITEEAVYSTSPSAAVRVVNINNRVAEFREMFAYGTYTAVITVGNFLNGEIGTVLATQTVEIQKDARDAITVQMNL